MLNKFAQTEINRPEENNLRYALFTEGKVTRDGRTINFSFAAGSSKMANAMDISDEEARAKIDWRVYEKTINAAFATPEITSMSFNGAWRPTLGDAKMVLGSEFDKARGKAGLPDHWGPDHTLGNALDIDRISGTSVNHKNYTIEVNNKDYTIKNEPGLIKQFTENLRLQKAKQVFQPWEMWKTVKQTKPDPNTLNHTRDGKILRDINWLHRNHLHVAY